MMQVCRLGTNQPRTLLDEQTLLCFLDQFTFLKIKQLYCSYNLAYPLIILQVKSRKKTVYFYEFTVVYSLNRSDHSITIEVYESATWRHSKNNRFALISLLSIHFNLQFIFIKCCCCFLFQFWKRTVMKEYFKLKMWLLPKQCKKQYTCISFS